MMCENRGMKLPPDSVAFIEQVEKNFSFLREQGFISKKLDVTNSPLTAGVLFKGKNVAIKLGLDRRDLCVDCYITRVVQDEFVKNDTPGGYWGPLHAFLVKHRGYRGSFKELRPRTNLEWYIIDLQVYAEALRKLAPDIVTDSDQIFENLKVSKN